MGNEVSSKQQAAGEGIPFVIWNKTAHFAEPSTYLYNSNKTYVRSTSSEPLDLGSLSDDARYRVSRQLVNVGIFLIYDDS